MKILFYLTSILILSSCIAEDIVDDFVPEEIRITSTLDAIVTGNTAQINASYFNNIGVTEDIDISWTSSNPNVLSIDSEGNIQAQMAGEATITATSGISFDEIQITVLEENDEVVIVDELKESSGNVATTTFYDLTGDFTLSEVEGGGLDLSFASNYNADTGLPGLYVYLTNNPNSIANALEIGAVQIFNGAHSYAIPNATLNEYRYILYWCKPFGVKVGQGDIQN